MDWLTILNQCLDILLPAVATVISVLLGVLAAKIKTTYNNKVQDETVRAIVESVVRWTQQVYKDCDGPEKLQTALQKASDILNEKGITVSESELNMLIESVVYGLKQGVTVETPLIEATTETTEQEQEAE